MNAELTQIMIDLEAASAERRRLKLIYDEAEKASNAAQDEYAKSTVEWRRLIERLVETIENPTPEAVI